MKIRNIAYTTCLWLGVSGSGYSMGLRSFVALPVEKGGAVIRLTFVNEKEADTLVTSAAYGVDANQTLLLGIAYRGSPTNGDRQGDVSALYRYIAWKKDSSSGTDRLGLLGGAIVPTKNDNDAAVQAGFVFTHFRNRHEIDLDVLYQSGLDDRLDRGRYDISWQYRISPIKRPQWRLTQELNTVLELNGRWTENHNITHQVTAGLQTIHQKLVVEGGVVRDINNNHETKFLLSTRFHF